MDLSIFLLCRKNKINHLYEESRCDAEKCKLCSSATIWLFKIEGSEVRWVWNQIYCYFLWEKSNWKFLRSMEWFRYKVSSNNKLSSRNWHPKLCRRQRSNVFILKHACMSLFLLHVFPKWIDLTWSLSVHQHLWNPSLVSLLPLFFFFLRTDLHQMGEIHKSYNLPSQKKKFSVCLQKMKSVSSSQD